MLLPVVHLSSYSRSRHSIIVLMAHFGHLQGSSLRKYVDFKGIYWRQIQIKANGTVNKSRVGLISQHGASEGLLRMQSGGVTWSCNFPVLLEIYVRSLLLILFWSLAGRRDLGIQLCPSVTTFKIGQNSKTFIKRLFALSMWGIEELKILLS